MISGRSNRDTSNNSTANGCREHADSQNPTTDERKRWNSSDWFNWDVQGLHVSNNCPDHCSISILLASQVEARCKPKQRSANKFKMSDKFPLVGEMHPCKFLLPEEAFISKQLFATKWLWLLAWQCSTLRIPYDNRTRHIKQCIHGVVWFLCLPNIKLGDYGRETEFDQLAGVFRPITPVSLAPRPTCRQDCYFGLAMHNLDKSTVNPKR